MAFNVYVPQTISPEAQQYLALMVKDERPLPAHDDLEGWRTAQRINERAFAEHNRETIERYQPSIDETHLGGVRVIDLHPRDWMDNGKALVYTHGGGYTLFSARSTLMSCVPLAHVSRLRVISVDYTLAPLASFDQIINQVVSVVEALLRSGYSPGNLAMFGDSAGGSLATGAVLKMCDQGLPMPASLTLWSPWADITRTGDSYYTLADQDLMDYELHLRSSAAAYAAPKDQRHPYVSPVYGDYTQDFPPTLIQGGTKDIFLSNCIRLYQVMDQAGVLVKLDLYEGMWHAFQALGIEPLPEAQSALRKTADFIKKHFRDVSS